MFFSNHIWLKIKYIRYKYKHWPEKNPDKFDLLKNYDEYNYMYSNDHPEISPKLSIKIFFRDNDTKN